MNRTVNQAADLLQCRFLFDGAVADKVFRESLEADIRHARLSRLFRAYYQLRSLIPLPVRQLLQRYRRVEAAPRWCYPDAFTTCLIRQIESLAEGITVIHPWPDGANLAFVLTHDIETAEGMRRVGQLADLEEALGFRSSWNFVPYRYPIDRGLIRELTDRGFEIGVHGYNHDGKLFTSRAVFERRVPGIQAALESFGAVGFRAPMVHRNLEWLQQLDILYDASCFDADPYQAMPGGVGGVWPFIAGRFVELPYTLPQDHTLFITLNERDGRIWQDKLDFLVKLRAMALVITHPDYLDSPRRIDAYRQLLLTARDIAGIWHALPKDVATWWRARDRSTLQREPTGGWMIQGPAADRARVITLRSTGSDDASRPIDAVAINGQCERPMLAMEWSNPMISGNV
jgi:peptidoglycan/xylan/chitin deacetylase (PgdA/CDA1 family)